ncbi:hypothetical protein Daura_06405 [Dactylosporangium aurantiacum]|uniref:Uncharacterized protein n=1 Tax=Dactylosporangium aurantiacum TaxID=35754 RepID=A0A9Q9IGL9_9ACTN|nr:hypothetical protein [Dactylosporangium aurantiacum]MDG6106136.1 hypothetical protein [Dactylosporangium aurantiacum]UWZ55829.1 hypothetical protein Daura_06405 [Dactylosporangium aurantiacum]
MERDAHAAVTAFVSRARRVEAHSLARDRKALVQLATMTFPAVVDRVTGLATIVQHLPPEELVESAAARVRPLILSDDPTFHAKVTAGLGYLLRAASAPQDVMDDLKGLRAQWGAIKPRGQEVRGYSLERSVAGSGVSERLADNVLGFAWIYGDVVHNDTERLTLTQSFGVVERFRAAVPLIAQIMVLTIATLNFIRVQHRDGLLPIDDGLFEAPVVVTETTFRMQGQIFLAELPADGEPLAVPTIGDELGPAWKPIHQVIRPRTTAGTDAPTSPATDAADADLAEVPPPDRDTAN